MAVSNEATPTKIFASNPVCMLCSKSKDSRHVVKISVKLLFLKNCVEKWNIQNRHL